MDRQDVQDMLKISEAWYSKHYAFLKQLVLMAGGALSILVTLGHGDHNTGVASILHRLALAAIGLGILAGAVALYGDVWQARQAVLEYGKKSKQLEALGPIFGG